MRTIFFCFNSRDGAIDSDVAPLHDELKFIVSIPEMVRLIAYTHFTLPDNAATVSIPEMVRLIDT